VRLKEGEGERWGLGKSEGRLTDVVTNGGDLLHNGSGPVPLAPQDGPRQIMVSDLPDPVPFVDTCLHHPRHSEHWRFAIVLIPFMGYQKYSKMPRLG